MAMGPLSIIGQSAARAGVPRSLYVLTVTIVMATVWLVADQGRTDRALRELFLGAAKEGLAGTEASTSPALRGRRLMDPPALPTMAPVTAPPLPTMPSVPTAPPVTMPTAPPVTMPTAPPVTMPTAPPVTIPATADLPAPTPAPALTTEAPPATSEAQAPSTSEKGSSLDEQQKFLEQQQKTEQEAGVITMVVSLLYGALYFCMVVQKYPEWEKGSKPTAEAKELMEKDEVSASCEALGDGQCCNCLLSYFCGPARAAHTMDKVGILSYWPALLLMACGCRFCLLFWANSFTDMNKRLGGKKRGVCMSCLCTFFCSCCVIYQDAVALDMNTGAETGCCSVAQPDGQDSDNDSN